MPSDRVVTVFSRAGCHLCEILLEQIQPLLRDREALRVIALDLRGRGESDQPESGYTMPDHAADVLGLMDHLEIDRANETLAEIEASVQIDYTLAQSRCIVSAGCEITPGTSVENLQALCESAAKLPV